MNITKAIADHSPDAIRELEDERERLVARVIEIELELARWNTLQLIVYVAPSPPLVVK